MSGEIRVGDLVRVAYRKPCGCDDGLDAVFIVTGFRGIGMFKCFACGHIWVNDRRGVLGYRDYCFDPARLRKIDPPATGEYDGVAVRRNVPVTA